MGLLKGGKQTRRQGQQATTLDLLEDLPDLLSGGAVNAGVGHGAFPIRQKQVLRRQTLEAAPFERIILGILHSGLDLTLVLGHRRPGRQNHRAIVPAKLLHLRVKLRLKPIHPRHRRPKIINDQGSGNPTKVTKRIFQRPDEVFRRLAPDHFAVSLARMAQHHPEQMRPPTLPLLHYPRSLTEIHLRLGSRLHLQALEGRIGLLGQTAHKAFDRVVAATKTLLPHQILVNTLRT